ncbi:hypothetical protein [Tessaracoccus flavescens]|uniref:Uncharacterized protein n=1 Tax=Tessaracoccus flavescens TaxID=399497 RepID=A0A1Q2CYB6_9ACTN|nr:hypothetical protein [Tessaracoccus flavescens]AQP51080.1 hypothetical protein BW733_09820 [Tessaracoccus flavescens]
MHVPAVAGANDNAANQKVLTPAEAAEIIIANGIEKGAYRVLVGRDARVMVVHQARPRTRHDHHRGQDVRPPDKGGLTKADGGTRSVVLPSRRGGQDPGSQTRIVEGPRLAQEW